MSRIILATTNPTKERLLAWLVHGLGLAYMGVEGLPPAPEETGRSFLENAGLKAQHWSRSGHTLAIASDGGLQVPGLGERWDPLATHRFAGPRATEEERARALLALMEGMRGQERRAFFVEAVALAYRGSVTGEWEAAGEEGLIVEIMPEQLLPAFWAASLLRFPESHRSGLELPAALGEADGALSAWAGLRPPVQAFLGAWLQEKRPTWTQHPS